MRMRMRMSRLLVLGSSLLSLAHAHAHAHAHGARVRVGSVGQGGFPDCTHGVLAKFPICDEEATIQDRAKDLVGRLTLDEKIEMLGTSSNMAPRVGIPSFDWWSEALHGVASSPGVVFEGELSSATSFPQVIGVSSSFDMDLVRLIGQAVSTEARAFSNKQQAGLVFFTPNINIFRDPRWGRGQETPGEDPYLTSQYVYTLITALQQGDDPRYQKIAPCCKHYAAYDLENWNGTDRYHFNAIVSDQDMSETYLPSFETCVRDAHVASIMCSYNAVNGVPSCANKELLQDVLRGQWSFDGFIVSDCGAIDVIYDSHHYANTVQDAVADAFQAGVSLDCEGSFYKTNTPYALGNHTVTEEQLDSLIQISVESLLKLGYFDDPSTQPYRQIPPSVVNSQDHQNLALRAAHESIVLLKNEKNMLPLDPHSFSTLALIGPSANATTLLQGNYFGVAPFLVSPLMGFGDFSPKVLFAKGCDISSSDTSGFEEAISAAKQADYVVYVGGNDQSIEAEGLDRTNLSLPGVQWDLIKQLESVSSKPIIMILLTGGPIDVSYAKSSPSIGGILFGGYPGQSGGRALADVVYGQYNPAGRLTMTWYPADYVNQVSMFDMNMRPDPKNPGRTYKFYTGTPVYEFGYGLSYTSFSYSWTTNDHTSHITTKSIHRLGRNSNVLQYRVTVTNTGQVAGDDIVLLFLSASLSKNHDVIQPPLKQLVGFKRVHLKPAESTTIYFAITPQQLAIVHPDGKRAFAAGDYKVMVGFEGSLSRAFKITGRTRKANSF